VLGGSVNNDMLTLLGDYPDLTILCGTNAGLALCLALAEGPISEAELEDIIRQSREQIINCTRLMKDTPKYEEEDL
jgi:mannose/fructose-specific phosphotransferase system component IIA